MIQPYKLCINASCRKKMPPEASYCPACFSDLKPVYKGILPRTPSQFGKSCFDCEHGQPINSQLAHCKLANATGYHDDFCDKYSFKLIFPAKEKGHEGVS